MAVAVTTAAGSPAPEPIVVRTWCGRPWNSCYMELWTLDLRSTEFCLCGCSDWENVGIAKHTPAQVFSRCFRGSSVHKLDSSPLIYGPGISEMSSGGSTAEAVQEEVRRPQTDGHGQAMPQAEGVSDPAATVTSLTLPGVSGPVATSLSVPGTSKYNCGAWNIAGDPVTKLLQGLEAVLTKNQTKAKEEVTKTWIDVPKLAELSEASAVDFGDWVNVMGDLSTNSGEWWRAMLEDAQSFYQRYTEEGQFVEKRTALELLSKLMMMYRPGSTAEKSQLLKKIEARIKAAELPPGSVPMPTPAPKAGARPCKFCLSDDGCRKYQHSMNSLSKAGKRERCYVCGTKGHLSSNCPTKTKEQKPVVAAAQGDSPQSSTGGTATKKGQGGAHKYDNFYAMPTRLSEVQGVPIEQS
ncbi:unnamed protein product [Symbiodinium sp. CCMP2592]|nr:unnamed protein product [Symbiodinium sp. CCMP2592]